MGTVIRGMPVPEIVQNFVGAGTFGASGGQNHPVVAVSVPIPRVISGGSAGTGNAEFAQWINPESGTILVTDVVVYFTTTGTGTYDIGISSDGTGSASDIVSAATMSALNYAVRSYRGRTGTQGAGAAGMQDVWRLGPSGSGTNNSIVGKTAEVTSTAKGRMFVTYVVTGT